MQQNILSSLYIVGTEYLDLQLLKVPKISNKLTIINKIKKEVNDHKHIKLSKHFSLSVTFIQSLKFKIML